MRHRLPTAAILAIVLLWMTVTAVAQNGDARRQLARDILAELIEINTVTTTGDTHRAVEAVAARLRAAGFSDSDVEVFNPAPRKGNLVARLRGSGARRPMLLVAHIDVVEALPADWSVAPFTFVEQDGYYYGRGTADAKSLVAAWVTTLITFRREGFIPARDIVLVLETDEESGDVNGLGMQWLMKNHPEFFVADFALNEGGALRARGERLLSNDVQTSEKQYANFRLEIRNRGGHSSVPLPDNAIYRLAASLTRLANHRFPLSLSDTTRAWLQHSAVLESPEIAAAMRAVASGDRDTAVIERLSAVPGYNAQLRTTCVATRLEGGHADNALPQRAAATVNCRILPGVPTDDVKAALEALLADSAVSVTPVFTDVESPASPLDEKLFGVVTAVSEQFWPGLPVVPTMSTGGTDSRFLRRVGIPTYGVGFRVDVDDIRSHGRDERLNVEAFHTGVEYLYRLVRQLSSAP